jgi:protein-S-isoprenylcysteine O-methyltransferase Ste14
MALFSVLLLEFLALVGTVFLIGFVVLLFRNPYRARWFRTETAETAAALVVVAVPVFIFAVFTSGLTRTGLNLFAVLAVAVTVLAVATFVAARLFKFRERLQRADSGQNPFRSNDKSTEGQAAPQILEGY